MISQNILQALKIITEKLLEQEYRAYQKMGKLDKVEKILSYLRLAGIQNFIEKNT